MRFRHHRHASISKDIAYEATQQADFVLVSTRPAVFDVMAMTAPVERATNELDLVKAEIDEKFFRRRARLPRNHTVIHS
jgi:Ser-tRNA(Ala) deacylase AlaX